MTSKTKDCVFAIILIAFSGVVIQQSNAIIERAKLPPYNIQSFSISPGMLPMVLGIALLIFSTVLLIGSLVGGERPPVSTLVHHIRQASSRFGTAVTTVDVISMLVCTAIMAAYTFLVLGNVPFWLGAIPFLIVLMLFIRATKIFYILLSSGISVVLMYALFVYVFKTTLP